MFEEITAVIEDLQTHIGIVKRNVIFGGDYFHALALAVSYNHLIELADTRTQTHPEVQRVPSLRYILLEHLYNNADRHINLQRDTIFDDSLLGGPRTLREWQDAGYHTSRTASNYGKRFRYWQAIYDDAPVQQQQQRIDTTPGDIFGGVTTVSAPSRVLTRPRSRATGQIVTYEDVIRNRDVRYGATAQLVPWWRSLNYGTGGQGYPVTGALHFVEDAERRVPATLTQYAEYFEQFVNDVFNNDTLTQDDIHTVESWARQHIQLGAEYIPSFDIARITSFGVPF
jgi:hypothetical protein